MLITVKNIGDEDKTDLYVKYIHSEHVFVNGIEINGVIISQVCSWWYMLAAVWKITFKGYAG